MTTPPRLAPTGCRYIVGDVFDVLATLEPASADLVLTSPPFLAIRDYLPADHPDKAREIGSEANPGVYVDRLLDVVEACDRVLAPHGSICFELGDIYANNNGDYFSEGSKAWHAQKGQHGTSGAIHNSGPGWPLSKSLCLIPETFRWALVYGHNPHTGRQTPRWRARNVVRWVRPNPPVGALGDKFRPGTTELVVCCKDRRYFDLDAVRSPHQPRHGDPAVVKPIHDGRDTRTDKPRSVIDDNPAGAPPLDWWEIPTHPYPGAHYATWPPALCETPIEAMCPRRVCTVCGQPSRRIVEGEQLGRGRSNGGTDRGHALDQPNNTGRRLPDFANHATVGWSDCGHGEDHWRPGLVLDPFAGTGTTLAVAHGHGRSAIGIDIDERNAWLARNRVGMFLDMELAPPGRDVADVPTGGVL